MEINEEWQRWRGHSQALLENMDATIKSIQSDVKTMSQHTATKDDLKAINLAIKQNSEAIQELHYFKYKVIGGALASVFLFELIKNLLWP